MRKARAIRVIVPTALEDYVYSSGKKPTELLTIALWNYYRVTQKDLPASPEINLETGLTYAETKEQEQEADKKNQAEIEKQRKAWNRYISKFDAWMAKMGRLRKEDRKLYEFEPIGDDETELWQMHRDELSARNVTHKAMQPKPPPFPHPDGIEDPANALEGRRF